MIARSCVLGLRDSIKIPIPFSLKKESLQLSLKKIPVGPYWIIITRIRAAFLYKRVKDGVVGWIPAACKYNIDFGFIGFLIYLIPAYGRQLPSWKFMIQILRLLERFYINLIL